MEITIAEIQENDLFEIEKLYFDSIRQNASGFIQRLDLMPDIKDVVFWKKKQGDAFFYLKKHQEIVGMCGLVKKDDGVVELSKFHIKKEYQNQGLGKKMLLFVQKYASNNFFNKIVLHVSKTQKAAIALYLSQGFEIIEQRDCIVEIEDIRYCYPTFFMQKNI
ncbi:MULTISPECIES: GNAT family N-acetyltransferase [unclassified Helicobacter]|uniref:GNAT family N-acetyltransferase n=1 Tax=unclassified Helicobacter TaxID=2593540 RepID=UPI000CF19961|nr:MULTISPECIES: GNAT family N-acetyltransferase [unclassified Helicobacter]